MKIRDFYLAGDGGASLAKSMGCSIAPIALAVATLQQNFDKALKRYQRSIGSSGANEWKLFANLSWYTRRLSP